MSEAKRSALGLASARERRQRADVPLRRDVNDNRSPKKKMRLGCRETCPDNGVAKYRSRYLAHAKRALYHLS